jgi:hypothetical protein
MPYWCLCHNVLAEEYLIDMDFPQYIDKYNF